MAAPARSASVSQAAHAPHRNPAGRWPEQRASFLGPGGLRSEMEVRAGLGSAEASPRAVPRPLRWPSDGDCAGTCRPLSCADGGPAGQAGPGDPGQVHGRLHVRSRLGCDQQGVLGGMVQSTAKVMCAFPGKGPQRFYLFFFFFCSFKYVRYSHTY